MGISDNRFLRVLIGYTFDIKDIMCYAAGCMILAIYEFYLYKTDDSCQSTSEEFTCDPDVYKAVLRCSICNGEQVAGFKNKKNGQFTEVCLIKDKTELEMFMNKYGLSSITKEY